MNLAEHTDNFLMTPGSLSQTTIDSLDAHIAVLDQDGVIVTVNAAWVKFGLENGAEDIARIGEGASYLGVCRQAVEAGVEDAPQVLAGLEAVLDGGHVEFSIEYPCHAPSVQRWFQMHITPLTGPMTGAIVSHSDITVQMKLKGLLDESEARYQRLFDQVPVGLLFLAPNGQLLDANQALVKMLGYPNTATLLSADLAALFPGADQITPWHKALARGARVAKFEAQAHCHNGEPIWLRVNMKAVHDPERGPLYYEAVIEDQTLHKNAEAQVQSLVEFNQEIVQTLGEGVVVQDANGDFTFLNPRAGEMLGYAPEELIGRHWKTVIPPEHHAKIEAADQRRLTGKSDRYEVELLHRDGRHVPVIVSGRPRFDSQSRYSGTLAVFTDISEGKRREAALRESEIRYRTLFENAAIGLGVADRDGNLLTFNDAIMKPGGYTREEIARLGNVSQLYYHKEDRDDVLALLKKQGFVDRHQVQFRRKDGSPYDALLSLTPISLSGQPALQAIVEDITEQVQHERERKAILEITTTLRRNLPLRAKLPIFLDQVMALVGAGGAALALRSEEGEDLSVEVTCGAWAHANGMRIPAGQGLSGRVLQTGLPYQVEDARKDPDFLRPDLLGDMRAVACVPLITRRGPIGTLAAARTKPFSLAEVQLLSAIGDMTASAIQQAMLQDQTQRRLERLAALRAIDNAIITSPDLQTPLEVLLDQLIGLLKVDAGAVWVFNNCTQILELKGRHGFPRGEHGDSQINLGQGITGRVAVERRAIHIPDLADSPERLSLEEVGTLEGFRSYCGLPLVSKNALRGVLEVFQRDPTQTDADWIAFLETLAGQAAIAIENATLFDTLQRSNQEMAAAYDTTLEGWARALELRDRETQGHAGRVNHLTLQLARAVGVPKDDLIHVRRGALLHDIGKMAIPDAILLKPGPLTEDEWEIMRQHPMYAYQLLAPIPFLQPALDIPYSHHERWDGSGYPRGLRGDQIPLAARVFAVVDVYDALCSDRPYRPAWPEPEAREYLRAQAGRQFDPDVVAAFLDLLAAGDSGSVSPRPADSQLTEED